MRVLAEQLVKVLEAKGFHAQVFRTGRNHLLLGVAARYSYAESLDKYFRNERSVLLEALQENVKGNASIGITGLLPPTRADQKVFNEINRSNPIPREFLAGPLFLVGILKRERA